MTASDNTDATFYAQFEFESLEFRNVSFSYPARPGVRVLKSVSFSIQRGEFVGILGETGAGKSSIFALLLRLYDPDSGDIVMNGKNLRSYNVVWLRRFFFSVVGQDLVLLERSIKDNVTYGYGGGPNESGATATA